MENQFLTRSEVATLLRVTPQTIDNYTKQGIVKFYKLGKKKLAKREEVLNSLVLETVKVN